VNQQPTSCKAIIKYKDKFLVYLRDDKDTIPFPGYWDFFGGGIEENETLQDCIDREIMEELTIEPKLTFLEVIPEDTNPIRYVAVFKCKLSDDEYKNVKFTGEGQKYDLVSSAELGKLKLPNHFKQYLDEG